MAQKKKAAKSRSAATAKPRVRQATKKQAKKHSKKETHQQKAIPNSFKLTGYVFSIFKAHWKTLLGIVAVYLVLNIIFASGLSSINTTVSDIKANLNNTSGNVHPLANGISGFGSLVGSAGATGSATGSILQSVLFVLESLVIIWALRQLLSGNNVGIKESYYSSMYPLIPFLLVLFVIILQLLPMTIGATVLNAVLTSTVASATLATWISWILFLLLAAWSFYMVSSSVFALYIVTLPNMQPRQALRSAKKLVKFRRWTIIPKILYLPVFILLAMAVVIIPLIIFASFVVAPVFYILSMLAILFIHAYLYTLYRSLIA